jgi:hypothetical protein
MLKVAYCRLVEGRLTGLDRNAWLEVFLLHARALADFFRNYRKQDDVVAQDFVAGWSPGVHGKWLEDHKVSLNKSLAHITATRVRERTPVHPVEEWYGRLTLLCEDFEQGLPANLRGGGASDTTPAKTSGGWSTSSAWVTD